jgi:peptidoglycan L-alanyl-D-glutamate endopeptidase CwlK
VSFRLGTTSLARLQKVHPLLSACVVRAIQLTPVDFTVFEGMRSMERQRSLFETGKTKTLNSRHLVGKAVDIPAWIDGRATWDLEAAKQIAGAMYQAAKECGVTLRWGGTWSEDPEAPMSRTFVDAVHFELSTAVYG